MAVRAVDVIVVSVFMLYTASSVVSLDLATLLRNRQALQPQKRKYGGKIHPGIIISITEALWQTVFNDSTTQNYRQKCLFLFKIVWITSSTWIKMYQRLVKTYMIEWPRLSFNDWHTCWQNCINDWSTLYYDWPIGQDCMKRASLSNVLTMTQWKMY